MDIEAQAVAWLRRRNFWVWSRDDQAALDAWLNSSLDNRVAYWRLKAAFERTARLTALRPVYPEQGSRHRFWSALARIAAGFVVVITLGATGTAYLMRPQEKLYETAVGGHKTITLADGSEVELNTATTVRVIGDRRELWLDRGEAFFRVKHDAAHPFVVMAAGHRVTDLGTKFLVRNISNQLEVALIEGRVQLDAPDGRLREPLLLAPGDVAVAKENIIYVEKKSNKALRSALAWRQGMLVFNNTTLGDAAAEFNRYNDRKIVIADRTAAQLTLDGKFRSNDIGDFTHLTQTVFALHARTLGNQIVISR